MNHLDSRVRTTDAVVSLALSNLPVLAAEDIPNIEDSCPICLLNFESIISDTLEANTDSRSKGEVTRIDACGHMFCMNDLSEWVRGRHGTCPSCRYPFLPDLKPVDSDDESSDGGEYVPTEYDADTDYDTDLGEIDGLFGSDVFDYEVMDIDPVTLLAILEENESQRVSSHRRNGEHDLNPVEDESWWDNLGEPEEHEWGLTDGESMGTSEGELSLGEQPYDNDSDIQIRLSSSGEYAVDDAEPATHKFDHS